MARWDVIASALGASAVLLAGVGCGPRMTTVGVSGDGIPRDAWSRGVYEYNRNCAGCHGEDGQGEDDAPPLIGEGAWPQTRDGRDMAFETAADAHAYVKENMPPMEAGELADGQYWVILHYVLQEHGRKLPTELSAENAANVTLR